MDYSQFTRTAQTAAERGTGPPAHALLQQCGLLPKPPENTKLLDIACGMGVVTAQLLDNLDSEGVSKISNVVCGDNNQTMLDMCKNRIEEKGWQNVEARKIDALATGLEDGYFTHALMTFGPQLMSDPIAAFKEIRRVLQPSGILGFTSWTSPGWIPSVQEVLPMFKPPPLLMGPWSKSETIRASLSTLGFVDIKVSTFRFDTDDKDIDAYLEHMQLLLGKVLVGEIWDKYSELMRKKMERGEMGMQWECLVVNAVKA